MTNAASKLVAPTVLTDIQVKHPNAPDVIDLLGDIVRAYTRHHKDLKVHGAQMTAAMALSVQGNKDDHGRLVGTRGANILALQTVFKRIGRKLGAPIQLTLIPPTVGTQEPLKPFESDPNFRHGATTALLQRTLAFCLAFPYQLSVADVGENTIYELKPDEKELPVVRGDLAKALHNIFHAIGKTRGRIIQLNLTDEAPEASADWRPMTAAEPPAKVRGERKPSADELEAEAREKGGAV